MRGRRSNPFWTLVLVLACLGLGGQVYLQQQGRSLLDEWPIRDFLGEGRDRQGDRPHPPVSEPPSQPAEGAPLPGAAEFALPPRGDFEETLLRPLFETDRRPPAVEEGPVAAPSARENPFLLVGVIEAEEKRLALVSRGRGGEIMTVGEGQTIDGWRVEAVQEDRVLLVNGEQRSEMRLEDMAAPARKLRTDKAVRRVPAKRKEQQPPEVGSGTVTPAPSPAPASEPAPSSEKPAPSSEKKDAK